jgi:hypothetical protein
VFCRSLFVRLAIVLSLLLRFADSDDIFGIFKVFLKSLTCAICKLLIVNKSENGATLTLRETVHVSRNEFSLKEILAPIPNG